MTEGTTTKRSKVPSLKVTLAVAIFSLLSYAGWDYAFDKADGHCIGPVCVGNSTPTNQGEHLE